MRKVIDVLRTYKSFEGEDIIDSEKAPIQLKRILLTYIRNAEKMGLSEHEQQEAYNAGFLIAKSDDEKIELTNSQYNAIKKLSDFGKIKLPNGNEESIFSLEVKIKTREYVDSAETIDENA